ncbi:MAG: hypothetical protein Q4F95_08875 [Oscillospiraceae bacterium]|nr:hypothetical protein [Oscillospiraceae bacterium]
MNKKNESVCSHDSDAAIIHLTRQAYNNKNFRTEIWTGRYMQAALMSIGLRSETGVKMHEYADMMIRVESGYARVYMGQVQHDLKYAGNVSAGDAVFIASGTWNNIVNASNRELKLSIVYSPPQLHRGSVYRTKNECSDD